ncbi:hypothetical protein [Novosphingobium sp. 9U]|uniref:hypothetical protein n=1 Tax=Novosphingobium sp. 9U TaxID=2653158 RepID=UPI0012F416A9|nr:hypothetical protein [Novosphingobium sp. 9U]VWX54102.1 Flagellar hook-length control protein fliK [Novosphingobium sp. 9U]
MKKIIALAAVATVATFSVPAAFAETTQSVREVTEEAAPAAKLNAGQMLYSNGARLAPIYRVNAEGNPQIILAGKLVTVPASTITSVGGKVTTSLSKKEVASAK